MADYTVKTHETLAILWSFENEAGDFDVADYTFLSKIRDRPEAATNTKYQFVTNRVQTFSIDTAAGTSKQVLATLSSTILGGFTPTDGASDSRLPQFDIAATKTSDGTVAISDSFTLGIIGSQSHA